MTSRTVGQPPARPTMHTQVADLIQRLVALPAGRHHVLSSYVRLEPRDRVRDNYLIAFKDAAKALRANPVQPPLSRKEALAVGRDVSRMLSFMQSPRDLPYAPGLAIFACEELGLFEAVPVSRVHRTRLILDDTPWIAGLLASEQEGVPVLVVIVDRRHARFFHVTPGESTELPGLVVISTRGGKFHSARGDAPGWGEHDYQQRLEQEHHRHYANVVQRTEELLREAPFRGVILAGPVDHTAALARFLPDDIAKRLLGTAKLNPTAVDAAELRAAALEVAEEHSAKLLTGELRALDEAVGSGWAVNGARETLRALHQGQVRSLFIRDNLQGRGFRCSATGRMVLARGDCRNEGQPRPVRDLADEAVEEALRQRARVVIVPECTGAEAVDGLAATIRFR